MQRPGVDGPISLAPDHPDLQVAHWVSSSRRHKAKRLFAIPEMSPPANYVVFNNNIVNLERAVKERVFYVPHDGTFAPPPLPVVDLEERLLPFAQKFDALACPTTPLTYDEFVGSYGGRKREVYQAAVDSLYHRGVSKADAKLRVFVKSEKVDVARKPNPVPRVIQPRSARFNVELGVLLKKAEKMAYNVIDRVFGYTAVCKGYNSQTLGRLIWNAWSHFKRPAAVGVDAKRYDQHNSVPMLAWEHRRWLRFARPAQRSHFAKLLREQLDNRASGVTPNGKVKYRVRGKRMSGDMNTGSGNVVNMCAKMYCFIQSLPFEARLINNGDDCVLVCEDSDMPELVRRLPGYFLEMGFEMEVEAPVYEIEQIEFCQSRPVWTPEGYLMVRNPHTSMGKDCISIPPIESERDYRGFCGAVGTCGLALCGGIPVLQDFYQSIARASHGQLSKHFEDQNRGLRILSSNMNRTYRPIDPRSRYSFWLAFGTTPDQQIALEEYYQGHTPEYAPCIDDPFNWPTLPAWL